MMMEEETYYKMKITKENDENDNEETHQEGKKK